MNRLYAAMLTLLAMNSTSFAADKIVSEVNGKDVHFFYESCPEECQVATLMCTDSGTIGVTLADVDAKNAAKAITELKKQMVLTVGKMSFDYFITEMDYMELTGSWWLTAIPDDVNMRELAPALAAVNELQATAGGHTMVMPVDAAVQAWAVGCK